MNVSKTWKKVYLIYIITHASQVGKPTSEVVQKRSNFRSSTLDSSYFQIIILRACSL